MQPSVKIPQRPRAVVQRVLSREIDGVNFPQLARAHQIPRQTQGGIEAQIKHAAHRKVLFLRQTLDFLQLLHARAQRLVAQHVPACLQRPNRLLPARAVRVADGDDLHAFIVQKFIQRGIKRYLQPRLCGGAAALVVVPRAHNPHVRIFRAQRVQSLDMGMLQPAKRKIHISFLHKRISASAPHYSIVRPHIM